MADTQERAVRCEHLAGGRLARLVLDAGKGNVIGSAQIAEMRESVATLAGEQALCGVVLDHEGPHFSFGASVPEHAPGLVESMLPSFHALARELLGLALPTVAAVRGACLGGGLELALLADRIVLAPDARLGQPEVQLGVFAPLGSALLGRKLAPGAATDLLVTGRTIDADEALALGLVQEIAEDPGEAARAWAVQNLVPKSAAALRFATGAARRPWQPGFLADLEELERVYLERLTKTHDAQEGIDAFLAKRPARWEDR